jgi:hypothetical protein
MGHHEAYCNADHSGPVGNPGCSCEAGREIKRLRAALVVADRWMTARHNEADCGLGDGFPEELKAVRGAIEQTPPEEK